MTGIYDGQLELNEKEAFGEGLFQLPCLYK